MAVRVRRPGQVDARPGAATVTTFDILLALYAVGALVGMFTTQMGSRVVFNRKPDWIDFLIGGVFWPVALAMSLSIYYRIYRRHKEKSDG